MIKKELLILLHHDALYNPSSSQQSSSLSGGVGKKGKDSSVADERKHLQYLEKHKYDGIDESDLQAVKFAKIIYLFIFFKKDSFCRFVG